MNKLREALQMEFDACSGASFSLAAVARLNFDSPNGSPNVDDFSFYWLLMSEAIARAESDDSIFAWIDDQIQILSRGYPDAADALRKNFAANWSAWLPILFFVPEGSGRSVWHQFCQNFPPQSPEQEALREVFYQTITRHGRALFKPGDWQGEVKHPDRYTSPEACAMLKLGLTLKNLEDKTKGKQQKIFKEWANIIRTGILRRLPERIQPGFAAQESLFEEFVLALLRVAEWLHQPELWRIEEFLRDNQTRPKERFNSNQLALAGGLFGWIRGYQKVASWLADRETRKVLSQTALRQALQRTPGEAVALHNRDPFIFYASLAGDRYHYSKPYVILKQIKRLGTGIIFPQENWMIPERDWLEVWLAEGVFRHRIRLKYDNRAGPVN
jgi:hypothetical protein